jgi:hypothetical protein
MVTGGKPTGTTDLMLQVRTGASGSGDHRSR